MRRFIRKISSYRSDPPPAALLETTDTSLDQSKDLSQSKEDLSTSFNLSKDNMSFLNQSDMERKISRTSSIRSAGSESSLVSATYVSIELNQANPFLCENFDAIEKGELYSKAELHSI